MITNDQNWFLSETWAYQLFIVDQILVTDEPNTQ
jgi:hypothetical protein